MPHASKTATPADMPKYRCHKEVWALKIAELTRDKGPDGGFFLQFEDAGYWLIRAPAEMFTRYMALPGDYYVVYEDGYKSISPAKAFEEGYTRL